MLLATTRTIIQSVLDLFAIFQEIRPQQKPKQQSHQLLRSLLRRLLLLLFDKTYKNRGNDNSKEMNFLRHLQISKTLPNATKLAASKTPCIVYHLCNQETTWSTPLEVVQFLASHEDNYQNATVTCQGSSILKHFCLKHQSSPRPLALSSVRPGQIR